MTPKSYEVKSLDVIQTDYQSSKTQNVSTISLSVHDSDKNSPVAFEDALKETGFGKVQIKLIIATSLVLFTVLNETMGISYIIPAAQCDLDLSLADKGIMIGSYPWGYFGDTQGRRRSILISLAFSILFTTISVFMKNYIIFLICRLLVGFCIAGYSAAGYAYIGKYLSFILSEVNEINKFVVHKGEFNSIKNRAAVISWVTVSVGIASVYQPSLALWILSYDWSFQLYDGYDFRPWRLLLFLYAAPGIIGLIFMYIYPESPKYLLSQDKNEKALKILQWMYRTNKNKPNHDDLKVKSLQSETGEVTGKEYKGVKAFFMSLVNQTFPLFKPPYLIPFVACCFLHYGTFSVAGGMALFLPDTLNKLSKSRANGTESSLKVCDALRLDDSLNQANDLDDATCDDSVDPGVFIDSIYIGLFFLCGLIVLASVIKITGRRKIFIFTLLLSSVSGFILTHVTSHYLIIGLFCIFIFFCGMNVTVINSAVCDLIPTHLRAMAVCVAMMFGRLGSSVTTNLIGYFLERNCEMTYNFLAALVLVCLAISFILPDNKKQEKFSKESFTN
ncbi:CLUMA_CG007364, isoform A [Clunio marinus]|uniref:CLUMA_CG007364, isoform A n=1 Tax=Clunio marinus TaxID=568069 RepID=A0A1J1I0N9_9DIPT|nr:CLUMA_CG007364, isoform A [Clunio marinus]